MFKIIKAAGALVPARGITGIFRALMEEEDELKDEINIKLDGKEPGVDGIAGEAVDCILCLIDIIQTENPDMTEEQFLEIVKLKTDKWVRVYGNGS